MSSAIEDAAAAARRGELIVLPTDTVYGIGTRSDDPAATDRIFEAKARPRDLELPVLVATMDDARPIARLDERAETLARAFWPGALTLVLPRATGSSAWHLGGDAATIGVRVPAHPLARAVLALTGPLAVSSANRSGEPTPEDCEELHGIFADLVAVYLCDERRAEGAPSTVVDLTGGDVRVLREGALPASLVIGTLGGH